LVSVQKPEVADVEIDDAHYPSPARVAADIKDPRRKTYPMAYLENPNIWEERNGADYGSLDLWANVIDRAWAPIWNDDHLCGSFLWEWRDRAVADPGPVHLYDYDPVTGISLAKVKGLCDPFGNPRAGYYQVKVVYAPIKVNLQPKIVGSTIVVHAENHYSFTDLSELSGSRKNCSTKTRPRPEGHQVPALESNDRHLRTQPNRLALGDTPSRHAEPYCHSQASLEG
jgi:hypothetical protein